MKKKMVFFFWGFNPLVPIRKDLVIQSSVGR